MQPPVSRAPLIDTLKGLACIAIVWHHLAFYGPMSDAAMPLFPGLMAWLYNHARLAVQVFLVLGGYLAAGSLAPQGVARFDSAVSQIGKRFVRLMVPLAAALALAIVAAALVRPWLDHPSVPGVPQWPQLLAHALLLQDVLGEEALSAGVWYVAIDFQLFAGTALLFAGMRKLLGAVSPAAQAHAGQALVVAGVAGSLYWANREPALDVWGIYFFGAYGLGMLARWTVRSPRPMLWCALLAFLALSALALEFRSRIAVAVLVAWVLVLFQRWAPGWPGGGWADGIQRVGRMSYSVFLVHFPVCLLVNALWAQLWPAQALPNALGMLLAFVLSLAAGRWMYRRVEQPMPTGLLALRWQAGLLGLGLLVLRVDAVL
jgi:peptidoglycan/LPS O-acetylase OafA/YrhL